MNGSGTRSHVRQLPRDTEPTRRFVSFLFIQTVPTSVVVAPVESGIRVLNRCSVLYRPGCTKAPDSVTICQWDSTNDEQSALDSNKAYPHSPSFIYVSQNTPHDKKRIGRISMNINEEY